MKKTIILAFLIPFFIACNRSEETEQNYEFLNGDWVYRSMHNVPDENIPFCEQDSTNCKNNLEFATAIMRLNVKDGIIDGELDMGQWGKLKMTGKGLGNSKFEIRGNGIPNTSTEGWIYDYYGIIIPKWENGIEQADALVGSVIRSADHGTSLKGKVASYYMVKK